MATAHPVYTTQTVERVVLEQKEVLQSLKLTLTA